METLLELLEYAVSTHPYNVALEGEFEGRGLVSLTRTDVLARAAGLAEKLIEAGVQPGDRVALLSCNRPEWAVGYFAVQLAATQGQDSFTDYQRKQVLKAWGTGRYSGPLLHRTDMNLAVARSPCALVERDLLSGRAL